MYDFLDKGLKYEKLNIYQKHKADFLEEQGDRYTDVTKRAYWIHLKRSLEMEMAKGKDLYHFDKQEIISVVKYTPTKSRVSKQALFSAISMYIYWACQRGFNYIGNPCDTIDTNDAEIFDVSKIAVEESYQTLEEFYEFILGLKKECTDVDRAMMCLLRYGVTVDYVGSIKWEDIDRENMILHVIKEDKEDVKLPIDNLFLMMIDKAKACKIKPAIKKDIPYNEYIYVVKSPENTNWQRMTKEGLYNRLGEISKKNQISRISVPDLRNARKFDFLYERLNKKGHIDSTDIAEVLVQLDGSYSATKIKTLRDTFDLMSGVKSKIVKGSKKLVEI